MRVVWATVGQVVTVDEYLQRLDVLLDDGTAGSAVAYPRLTGACVRGDRVQLNTTAVDLELGTGGDHFVVCRLGSGEGVALDRPSGGHIMKLRYTPLQVDVVAVESPESDHHHTMREAESLEGTPVVCCGLHSQVPLVAAAIKASDESSRVVYCMTDGAALPLALSDLVRSSLSAGLLDATVTCGQAFGGMLEAINLHSGMLAARHVLGADVVIVAVGPGIVGTATPFGHGGVAQGETINAAAVLGGVPVACLRMSFADSRERHQGVSHHTLAALSQVALAPAVVAVPALEPEKLNPIQAVFESAGIAARHRVVFSEALAVEPPPLRGVEVRTMGRTYADDPVFFDAAFAAGSIASKLARGTLTR
jgi:hypothetical protein